MKKQALVILADGFEETEAVTVIDVLRRSEINVTIAGLVSAVVTGGHNISIKCDKIIEECKGPYDALILPGGTPGAENLASSEKVKEMISSMKEKGKIIAAICASPAIVLAPIGILDRKKATCYPGMERGFSSNVIFTGEDVVQDGRIITSKGVGTALVFALKIAENLVGKPKAEMIAEQVLVRG
ncbi:MAG: DJ-1 family glyoxalase III [Candidatus Omnitrophota bacterium]|nr:DJ-1/PfpI family protein [Candidatus Omnitrophota bacterium]